MKYDKKDIFFIHIREPEEIDKFKEEVSNIEYALNDHYNNYVDPKKRFQVECKAVTLLIKRSETDVKNYGNKSDDEVENYDYDFTFINDKDLSISKYDFLSFIEENILPLSRQ